MGTGLELFGQRKDGTESPVEISLSPLKTEDSTLVASAIRDVTDRNDTERRVRAEQARLLDLSFDAIFVRDLEGRIAYWNKSAEDTYGYTCEEALGTVAHELLKTESPASLENIYETLHRDDRWSGELVHTRRDGRRITVNSRWALDRDANGHPMSILETNTDVTERKAAEEAVRDSQRRLEFALTAGHMGAWEWDIASGTVVWSPGLEDLHGLKPGTFGGTFDDFKRDIHPEDLGPVLARVQQAVDTARDYHVIYRINRGDGAVRWLEAFGAPIVGEDGKPQKLAGVCMDITERRRGEEALREADRRKDAFLAMLGHELRNPLAAIASAASVLSTAAQTLVPSGRPLEIIRRQTELLHRLVGDLVDVTRISAGKIVVDMTPLDLAESADACVTTLISARRMDKHLVDLKGDHVWINGDGARVEQIITNLLTNAIKFTPDGGTITVRVEAVGGEALLRVKDDGMGIPPHVLPRVFDLFAQGDPPAGRRPEGLGVGLTLVRQLVELHGGRVEARSDGVGRGSEFVVRFPVLLATQPGSARAGGSPRATTP